MINALLVGAGGFFGSIARYLLGIAVLRASSNHWFPLATLSVNFLGCLAIGIISGLVENKMAMTNELRLFLMVGLLGGFTTFSTFGNETVGLVYSEKHFAAVLNIALHIILCISAAWFGYHLTRSM